MALLCIIICKKIGILNKMYYAIFNYIMPITLNNLKSYILMFVFYILDLNTSFTKCKYTDLFIF